jgi:hypothetical protein
VAAQSNVADGVQGSDVLGSDFQLSVGFGFLYENFRFWASSGKLPEPAQHLGYTKQH